LNKVFKSSDLIGWRRREIGGVVIAQFVAREIKEAGWQYRGDAHEQAQLAFVQALIADGGDGAFCTGPGSF
jgi:hypothetical protein